MILLNLDNGSMVAFMNIDVIYPLMVVYLYTLLASSMQKL